jgi:hypothetical protein
METIEWWTKIDQATRDWLIAHNGEAVPAAVLSKITAAGGTVTSDAWWVGEEGPDGLYLSEEAVDWVETVANGEGL